MKDSICLTQKPPLESATPGSRITVSPKVRAKIWLEEHGYKRCTLGYTWYRCPSVGVCCGENLTHWMEKIRLGFLGFSADERRVLGILLFPTETVWEFHVIGTPMLPAATELCSKLARDLHITVRNITVVEIDCRTMHVEES